MTNSSYEPEVEPDDGLLAKEPERKTLIRRRRRRSGLLRRVLFYVVIVAMIPLALTILYIPSFVHPISTLMVRDLVAFQGYDRRWVPIDEISPNLVNAVIMSEDGQYCSHQGIDWTAMRSVIDSAMSGDDDTRGASTIPMQTVKNLFLWNGRSYVRKALEAPLALYFDFFMPKRRLMEIYLNIAEWGSGIYGAEAAAQHHFGRSAAELTARQGALLAVSLPNPITRNAGKPGPGLSRLANRIQARARQSGAYVGCVR
ncbi:monofunctional biosynthetic peptidoglycan transglycosylase [Limoniibacter endophyticus]|uniref:Biosynthetic peptidoglycan transglycosylase n=1 Tax=Limoniibacter endophyticus TaxID=1565040 RepID=A0A8J3GJC4_9HYPH|nr:monofunctional biosynthetic peptidoglycan transglycosylase [Limoniibacter endophyticus]GHC77170.1 monofunctional biosynthetic peptidoglycan transglycosylase [Limoniibacter endophyticus]